MRQDLPNTAGMFRPLRVITEPGSVVNVVMPGASSMRGVTGFRMVDAVFGALAGLLPDRILAAGEGGNTLVVIGGKRQDGSPYVYYELLTGTWGGRPDRDANDGLCNPINVASNIPIEQAEAEYALRIRRYGLVGDSGGAGKYRGGLAVEREWNCWRAKPTWPFARIVETIRPMDSARADRQGDPSASCSMRMEKKCCPS